VERALILSDHDELDTADFQLNTGTEAVGPDSLNLEAGERRLVTEALEKAGGNISHAAALLGITRAALYRRIEKFQL
jgi:transcriptional regulator of acetoin/glycerol metabolism